MFLVINVSRIELAMSELHPSLRSSDERMHHMLHSAVMITFIGLDRPSAAPSVVDSQSYRKGHHKERPSPPHKHYARTPGPHAKSDLVRHC